MKFSKVKQISLLSLGSAGEQEQKQDSFSFPKEVKYHEHKRCLAFKFVFSPRVIL